MRRLGNVPPNMVLPCFVYISELVLLDNLDTNLVVLLWGMCTISHGNAFQKKLALILRARYHAILGLTIDFALRYV